MAPRALCGVGGLDVSWFPSREVCVTGSLPPPLGPQQTIDWPGGPVLILPTPCLGTPPAPPTPLLTI